MIAAARKSPGVRSVATIGAPMDPSHAERHYDAVVDRVLSEGSAEWMVGGRCLTLKRAFVEDVRVAALHEKIRGLRLPLLILHSPTDNTVGIANARRRLERMYGAAAELSVRNRPDTAGVEVTIKLPLARERATARTSAEPRVEVTV